MRARKIIPGVDPKLLIKDAAKLMPDPARRAFLRGAASLCALFFLTGCDIIDGDTAEGVLRKISNFNDGAQALLFSRTKLAPTFSEKDITRPFPFNAYWRHSGSLSTRAIFGKRRPSRPEVSSAHRVFATGDSLVQVRSASASG